MRSMLFSLILILVTQTVYAQMDEYFFTVVAPSGLSLRKSPSLTAKRLAVVPFNAQVAETEEPDFSQIDTIDGLAGYWVPAQYQQQKGYLFSPYLKHGLLFDEPSSHTDKDFSILIPGERMSAIHFDSSLHWYALQGSAGTDLEAYTYTLSPTKPNLQYGPELNRYYLEEYSATSDLVAVNSGLEDANVVLLIGSKLKLSTTDELASISFSKNDNPYQPQGLVLFPYQSQALFQAAAHEAPYFLYAEEQLMDCPGDRCKTYTLNITRSSHCYGNYCTISQSLSPELDLYADPTGETNYPRSFIHHPRLLWQADLNKDGAPELLFFQPNVSECCGGSEAYILLQSIQTSNGYRWERVATDEVEAWGGC